MLASSNTTTNENRRADVDTWIPAFAGTTEGRGRLFSKQSLMLG